ncbi:hypothetical protein KUTeg_008347 [Tegillarca granosa]|uniref:Mediator of RNA polymerase II transcription subunit 1 n=1 Tax=Tegillarca granosa TaxID=220873 RepID=A0ABQ9FB37_TEGGR|nr:hypothetical protein KUTeg_008347 [Tegillarca granosa]
MRNDNVLFSALDCYQRPLTNVDRSKMAAKLGVSPAGWENQGNGSAMKPEHERELNALMEKLRCRSTQLKNWTESINAVRTAVMNDKRVQSDALQRSGIQSCVDRLQRAIKVVNKHTLLERLDSITRQLGLTFTPPTGSDNSAFINTEMFYIEIVLEKEVVVKDVKICHQGDPVHLQGLLDMNKIPGDKKQKSKAFLALHSLETDLNDLAQLQSSINGVANYIHKSPLGILLPRKGGYPMKLIYFVSPYDLLDKKTKSHHSMTVEDIIEHDLGQSVTICIEQYASNRLQTIPLMSVIKEENKSTELPASFVLVLPQPVPVALSVVRSIQSVTNLDVITASETKTLLNLILEKTTNGKICDDSQFFVTLPDQQHVYFIRDVNGNSLDQPAVMVSHIPFTHPTNVAQVLNHLRQQLLFNTVVGSCIRPYANQNHRSSVVFELSAVSLQQFTIMFEHPLQDAMVTAELDLSDITNVKFKVCIEDEGNSLCSDDTASKIFQRCLSIPVTLRSVIFKVSEQLRKEPSPEPVPCKESNKTPQWFSSIMNYSNNSLASETIVPSVLTNMYSGVLPPGPTKPPPAVPSQVPNPGGGVAFIEPSNLLSIPEKEKDEKPQSNPLLATLLDQNSPSPEPPPVTESPMLSKLLEETTSLASALPVTKNKRGPKRKISRTDSSGTSPSTKFHRTVESENNNNNNLLGLESNNFDSDLQHPNSLHHQSGHTSIIDLTDSDSLSSESHVKKLENTMDNYISKQNQSMSQDNDNLTYMLSDYRKDMEPGTDPDSARNHFNTVPKNEKTSTSLEELLGRSGEVLKTKDLTYAKQTNSVVEAESPSTIPYNSFSRQNSNQSAQSQHSTEGTEGGHSNVGGKFTPSFSNSETSGGSTSNTPTKSCDTNNFVPCAMIGSRMAANSSIANTTVDVKREIKEEKYDGHDLKSLLMAGRKDKSGGNRTPPQQDIKNDKIKTEGKLKLKLPTGLRHLDRTSSSPSELLDLRRKNKSKEEMFEFNSDEDEPFILPITVSASPPIRLQISNKNKNSTIYDPKRKKKESRHSLSGESGKRKREKCDSKKEKKKKKLGDSYKSTSLDESAVYSLSTTVDTDGSSNDLKPNMKLKIIKSGVRLETSSPKTASPSNREKLDSSRKSVKEHSVKHSSSESSLKEKNSQKSTSHKSHRSSSVGSGVSKSDSKLMKTPTIKLKPITLPNSTSMSVSGAKTPTSMPSSSSLTPSSATPSPTVQQGKVSLTPTSTTIGRMGAVSLATSGVSSKGNVTQTPPSGKATTPTTPTTGKIPTAMTTSSGKATTPTSAKTPPGFNKGSVSPVYKSSASVSSTSGKSASSHSGKSSTTVGRSSSISGTGKSSSTKSYSGDRKGGSPSVSGGRNTPILSKSNSSHNKSPISTSAGSKSQPGNHFNNAASVLSFLNTNASGIASLPPIPKLSSASSGNASVNKTSTVTTTTTTTTNTNTSVNNNNQPTLSKPHQTSTNSSVASQHKGSPSISHVTTANSKSNTFTTQSNTTSKPNPVSRSNSSGGVSGGRPLSSASVKTVNSVYSGVQSKVESTNTVPSKSEMPTVSSSNKSDVNPASKISQYNATPSSAQNKSNSASYSNEIETHKKITSSSISSEISNSGAAKVRARKGSLSAIVDKLHVKQTSGTGSHCNTSGSSNEKDDSKQHHEMDFYKKLSSGSSDINESSQSESASEKSSVQNLGLQTPHEVDSVPNHKYRSDSISAKIGSGKGGEMDSSRKSGSQSEVISPAKTLVSKDSKNENRNLFTSILLSASEKKLSGDDVTDKNKNGQVSGTSDSNDSIDSKSSSQSEMGKSEELNSSRSPAKRSRTQSPSQNVNKLNGETGEILVEKKKQDVFKVPTPKAQQPIDEKDNEDTENLVVRKKPRTSSSSRPVLSPNSPVSSPENLIIDCQTMSPRTLQNKTNSPKCNVDISVENQNDHGGKRVNTGIKIPRTLTPSPKHKNSPLPSPVLSNKEHIHSSSVSNSSPCEIDDDLMDEVLMGLKN